MGSLILEELLPTEDLSCTLHGFAITVTTIALCAD